MVSCVHLIFTVIYFSGTLNIRYNIQKESTLKMVLYLRGGVKSLVKRLTGKSIDQLRFFSDAAHMSHSLGSHPTWVQTVALLGLAGVVDQWWISQRYALIDDNLKGIRNTQDHILMRLDWMEQRMTTIEQRMTTIEQRMTTIEQQLTANTAAVTANTAAIMEFTQNAQGRKGDR
ncbi:hypothetical protein COCOBI_16-4600 [Coccomyxa sp. Obi]|nr:hypothetical protein COCOBI_16-4600 [Coccomyxa sp. Obi]